MRLLLVALLAVASAACPGDDDDDDGPLFPDDYAATYQQVRDCRRSTEHDLNFIRVLADPDALGPYSDRVTPFPVGAVVLKEEYDIADATCAGPIKQWTVMAKLATDTNPEMLDWAWQRVSNLGDVLEQDTPRCAGCHELCGFPPDGYDGTCTVP
jgi:hypothetical protein